VGHADWSPGPYPFADGAGGDADGYCD
jgi:hypothetical protein